MSKIRMISLVALLGCAALPVAAIAADPSPAGAAKAKPKKGGDPNEVVCRKEEVLGSRLDTRRVCMTRSEWAEARRENRSVVERAQTQRPLSTQ